MPNMNHPEQRTLPDPVGNSQYSSVPSGRGARLWQMGRLAGGLAGGVMSEGLKRLSQGQRPKLEELLLTPHNAKRLSDQLPKLRGAAMKLGQLISMEAGELLPQEFSNLLSRLREQAHTMPLGEVAGVLNRNWGQGWERDFRRFHFTPLAAASIGQVHEAVTKDGQRLAIKVQYPGISRSIDSDVDNVATLLRLLRLLPDDFDLQQLLQEAKAQLHQEADYVSEAQHLRRFRQLLAAETDFSLPAVIESHTTREVLSMSYVEGVPIDHLHDQPRATRDRVAGSLVELALRECFEWGWVQSDPNYANFRYQPDSGRIGLLDFGATRHYAPAKVGQLRRLLSAAVRAHKDELETAAREVGYLDEQAPPFYREAILGLLQDVVEPVRHNGPYDFGHTELAARMSEKIVKLRLEQRYWHLPPVEILMLHRKLGGLYLICSRLRARLDVSTLISRYMTE